MIDKVNILNQLQNLSQSNKVQKLSDEQKSSKAGSVDEVVISKQAQDLAQIENIAKQVGLEISVDKQIVLSSDKEKLNAII